MGSYSEAWKEAQKHKALRIKAAGILFDMTKACVKHKREPNPRRARGRNPEVARAPDRDVPQGQRAKSNLVEKPAGRDRDAPHGQE